MTIIHLENTCYNIAIAHEVEVISPQSMVLQVTNHLDGSMTYERNREEIKKDLLLNQLDTSATVKFNEEMLQTCQRIINNLPKLNEVFRQKLIIPEFEEISVEKNDSAEIKKFIRKVNYEMLGFSCNHKMFDKKYDQVSARMADLFNSKSYKTYIDFLDLVASCVYKIRFDDNKGKKWTDQVLIPTGDQTKKVIDALVDLNGEIANINSESHPTCPKCKAACRKYDYSVREIERMRDEMNEQRQMDEEELEAPAEEKFSMRKFLETNYPTIDRFELANVKERYKKQFGISLKYTELTEKIEETGLFRISNVHRKLYVNRV